MAARMNVVEKIFAAVMVALCVLLLLRMLLRPRRRARVDASIRRGSERWQRRLRRLIALARRRAARPARDQGGDPACAPLGGRARRQRHPPEGLQGQAARSALRRAPGSSRRAVAARRRSAAQVPVEERDRALPRLGRGGRVVARRRVVVEAVLRAGIRERLVAARRPPSARPRRRPVGVDALVVAGEMDQQRRLDLRRRRRPAAAP